MTTLAPDTSHLAVLARARAGARLDEDDALTLLRSADLVALGEAARDLRGRRTPPDEVTFSIDRNVNYTNFCITDCDFCAFDRLPRDPEGYVLPKSVIFRKIEETLDLGGTALLLQGGHHPGLRIEFYEDLFRAIKARYPIHLHALSPSEVLHIAHFSRLSLEDTLDRLIAAGLDSIPGGGAEILVDRVRKVIAPKKTTSDEWLGVMRAAHRKGLSTTATMMYGTVDTLEDRVEHLRRLRELQDETGGVFTAFIPWTFQPENTAMGASMLADRGGLKTTVAFWPPRGCSIVGPRAVFSGWNVHGMNAVNTLHSACSSRMRVMCSMRSVSVSTWPNIIVAVPLPPSFAH